MHVGSPSSGNVAAFTATTQPQPITTHRKHDADGDKNSGTAAASAGAAGFTAPSSSAEATKKVNFVA